MTDSDTHRQDVRDCEPAAASDRQIWSKPELSRLCADDAEAGILPGPEIVFLLS